MKSLVLAEKPSVARDIARVLKCGGGAGFMEGGKYVVTWALGHLVTLAEPESYGEKYKSWKLEDLPIIPKKMELVVIKQTAKQYGIVKGLLKRGDIGEVIIATDAGREGELVARWILEKAGSNKPVKRLWVSSVTDKAITDGFKNLKDGRDYVNLYNSAQARAISDWLVGINATRALTAKFNAQLSCGRVQTPTLALIKSREDEIAGFTPRKYYGITALSEGVLFTWHDKNNGTRLFDKDECDKIINGIKGKKIDIMNVDKRLKKSYSKKLYDLTELQRDANRLYGLSAKETLNIMQQLYESHKVLTYPRTDSRYLTTDIVPTIPERLRAIPGEYGRLAFRILKNGVKANDSFVDNKKVSDHHAIIPTEQPAFLDKMTDRERKIYSLVIKRFLSVLLPPCEYEEITLRAVIAGETFLARGKRIVSQGYREVDASEDEDDEQDATGAPKGQPIPDIKKGRYDVSLIKRTEDQTKPPKPFNEATLLSAMENPQKYVKISAGLSDTLSEAGGLGTVATRADIIEKLFDSFSMEKRGNDIWLTSKGKQLLTLVPADLRKPELTAQWERELTKISKGQKNKEAFLREITEYTRKITEEIRGSSEIYRHDNLTHHKCPNCGKNMLEVKGKKGKMLVCRDRECGFRKSVSVITNARCPNCHKKLELVGEGDSKRFVCACGHSEKLSAWEKRRESEGAGVSKKDIDAYMRKQSKDVKVEKTVNSTIADALKGIKFD